MDDKYMENSNNIKKVKDLKDAKDDLKKLDEILQETHKFRQQSNQVYHRIVDNPEYFQYIEAARAANRIKVGNTSFENVLNYVLRRKIIGMLRQAVCAYIADNVEQELKKANN